MTHDPWRPDPAAEQLLRAALAVDDGAAAAAWTAWRAGLAKGGDTATAGPAEVGEAATARLAAGPRAAEDRLLPLAVTRLGAALDRADPIVARGLALRARARVGGLVLVRRAATLVRALAADGVGAIVLKGAALALRYYKDLGLRPMDDLDLLVRGDDVPRALARLHAAGYAPTEALPAGVWPPRAGGPNLARLAVTHACGFRWERRAEGRATAGAAREVGDAHQLDLHWAALATNCGPRADDRFWAAAVPLQLGAGAEQAACLALAPEHELVHALVHGLRWNALPSIRWIADAVTVMRAAPVDWARFEAEVDERGVAPDAALALTHLARYDAPIPGDVVARLQRRRAGPLERWRQAHSRWPWDRPKPAPVVAFDAWRFVEGAPPGEALATLGRYARFRLAPDGRLASVPRQLWDKLVGARLRR